jgi:hypothetical protein
VISKSIVGSEKVQRYFAGSSGPSHGNSGQSSRMRTSDGGGSTASVGDVPVGDVPLGSGSPLELEHDAARNIASTVAPRPETLDRRPLISPSPPSSDHGVVLRRTTNARDAGDERKRQEPYV